MRVLTMVRPTAITEIRPPPLTGVPLRSAFRIWASDDLVTDLYMLKVQFEQLGEIDEATFNARYPRLRRRAHQEVWDRCREGVLTLHGMRAPLTAKSTLEKISTELVGWLSPDFENNAASADEVRFLRIEVDGLSPIWAYTRLSDDVWGPLFPVPRFERNFHVVVWKGKRFALGTKQAKVIQLLHEAHARGRPWVSGKSLMALVESTRHLSDLFKSQPCWTEWIVREGRDLYRLNIRTIDLSEC
jgi:hypothetical protein